MRQAIRCFEWLTAISLGTLLFQGCGAEVYEQRIDNTRLLFAHLDLLNQHLQGSTWGDPETGVSLRVPLQFVMLPPPAKAEPEPAPGQRPAQGAAGAEVDGRPADKAEDAEGEEGDDEIPDDRQPKYINIGLPGLRGAFRAPVKMIAGNNAGAEGEAFLYVMTNHDLADHPDQAREFEQEFIKVLTETLHVSIESDKDWRTDQFPPGDASKNGFVRPLKYKNVTVTPGEDIAGYVRQFSAYMYNQGDIQVIVLFVLPADTDTSENLTRRIPLCLETLSVSGDRLALPAKGGAPGGGGTPVVF